MKVEVARPPMFDEIDAKFHIADQPIIFAWGDTIFNPLGIFIVPRLMVHEGVHGRRQGDSPAAWWRKYLDDAEFRLDEELRAHTAEYGAVCAETADREKRNRELLGIAKRISGPLYDNMITFDKARAIIALAAGR